MITAGFFELSPKQVPEPADINNRMRIDGATQAAIQALQPSAAQQTAKLNYQTKVLKKALDSQKDHADQLLKLIEPKGQVIDIKA